MQFGIKMGTSLRSIRHFFALSTLVTACLTGCSSLKPPVFDRNDGAIGRDETVTDTGLPPAVDVAADTSAITILYSGSEPAQETIAAGIGAGLASADNVHMIDIDAYDGAATIDAPGRDAGVVAAIGPAALDIALSEFAGAEIVYSQVIEPDPAATTTRGAREIASAPSPELLFSAWAAIDPDLKRIALITSPGFARRVPEATDAAAANGAELIHRIATSDREALYIFRRLAPTIDGLWLAPDSEILSTAMIDELLAHAAERDIGVLVFSDSLLERGGLICVDASEHDVASTVIETISRIRIGNAPTLPTRIPLREGRVRVNTEVAARLGLDPAMPAEWVIRDR